MKQDVNIIRSFKDVVANNADDVTDAANS